MRRRPLAFSRPGAWGGLLLALAAPLAGWAAPRPAAATVAKPAAAPAKKLPPNLLLVVADDLSAHLALYGYPEVSTPNLDKLAARGVRFEHAYSPYPICNPSRVSLLSGLSPETTQVFNNLIPPRVHLPEIVFLPAYLHDHGYFTYRAGKVLHSTFDDAAPFDEVGELNSVVWDAPYPKIRRPQPPGEALAARERQREEGRTVAEGPLGVDRLYGQALSDQEGLWLEDSRVAEIAVRFLHRVVKPAAGATAVRRPFFLAVGLGASHPPWAVPERWARRYDPARLPLAVSPPNDRADIPPVAFTYATSRPGMAPEKQREVRAAYFAGVSFLDEQLGRILDTLEETGLARDTIVVFVSDHGQHLGEHGGLWEKMTLFEETAQVPFLVAGPGIGNGRTVPCVVELTDVVPTLTTLAGLPTPSGLDGRSLTPFLEHPERCDERGALSWIWLGKEPSRLARSLRTARYRYTEWLPEGVAELYDHETDPGERVNRANDPAARTVRDELRRLLARRVAGLAAHARP